MNVELIEDHFQSSFAFTTWNFLYKQIHSPSNFNFLKQIVQKLFSK